MGIPVWPTVTSPKSIINGIQRRPGVKFEVKKYRDEVKVMEDLNQLIDKKQVVGFKHLLSGFPIFLRK